MDVGQILSDARAMLMILADEAGQELHVDLDDRLPPLLVDSDIILRVITNLVDNAVKYTPEGGRIVLSARTVTEGVLVSVRDNGPGIPPDLQEQIFDKYVRLKTNQPVSGAGLGLAFCRLAVEAHGGRIWVESDGVEGTCFSFILPVQTQAAHLSV